VLKTQICVNRPQCVKPHSFFNPLNAELNPICRLLALLEARPFFRISRIRVKVDLEFTLLFLVVAKSNRLCLASKRTVMFTYISVTAVKTQK